MDRPGIPDVGGDLVHELSRTGKFLLVPDPVDEVHPQLPADEIAVRVEDVHFAGDGAVSEGGVASDVHDAVEDAAGDGTAHKGALPAVIPRERYPHGVDSLLGDQLVLHGDVRRRRMEDFGSPPRPVDDDTADVIEPAEHPRGLADPSPEQEAPDPAAAHDRTVRLGIPDDADLEPVLPAPPPEQCRRSLLAPPEGVAVPDDHPPDVQPVDEHVPDKVIGLRPGEFAGKGDADEHLDAHEGDETHLVPVGGDQLLSPLGIEDPHGVGFKGDGNGGAADALRFRDDTGKDLLMAPVDAVEVSDGDDRVRIVADAVQVPNYFHGFSRVPPVPDK